MREYIGPTALARELQISSYAADLATCTVPRVNVCEGKSQMPYKLAVKAVYDYAVRLRDKYKNGLENGYGGRTYQGFVEKYTDMAIRAERVIKAMGGDDE